MHAVTSHPKKAEAVAAALKAGGEFVLIQAGSQFHRYTTAADLDADAAAYAGALHVRELVLRDRERRPFIDIDEHPEDLNPIRDEFAARFGAKSLITMATTKGYHIVADDVRCSFAEHVAGLVALREQFGVLVDAGAVHSLRLPGSCKPGGERKQHPDGYELSQLLCQPFDAAADESGADNAILCRDEPDGPCSELVAAAAVALSGDADNFELRPNTEGPAIILNRCSPSICNACEREHDHEGAYALRVGEGRGVAYCFRSRTSVPFEFVDAQHDPESPGLIDSNDRAETYTSAPTHEGGAGCESISGDYVDGSACGLGKSEAAWSSILPGQSVLCLSYRRAFTAKTRADYGLETLPEKGELVFNHDTPGRRAIVQVDSLPRVAVHPRALDVVVVDELRGIRRQLFGGRGGKRSNEAISRLQTIIQSAKRVIVLDADACNADVEAFEKLTGRPFAFVRNDYLPDTGKSIHVHKTQKEVYASLMAHLSTKAPEEKVAVFTHLKKGDYGVESLAASLQRLGLNVKYYHGGTCQKQRAIDFSDVETAFAPVDVVVYNATVEAGISIPSAAFTRLFIFSNQLGSVDVLKQASHRFRAVTRFDYASARPFTSYGRTPPQTMAGVAELLSLNRRGLAQLPNGTSTDAAPASLKEAIDSFAGRMYLSTWVEEFRSSAHYDARLLDAWRKTGYEIIDADAEPAPMQALPEPIEELVDEFLAAGHALRTAAAVELTCDEAEALAKSSAPKNSSEIASLDKFHFATTFEINPDQVTEAMVETFEQDREGWLGYKALLSGNAMPATYATVNGTRVSVRVTPAERLKRVSELTTALGFGALDEISECDPPVVAGRAFKAAATSAPVGKIVEELRRDWVRLFGSDLARQKTKAITSRSVRGLLKTILPYYYGLSLDASDSKNLDRGVMSLEVRPWPAAWLDGVDATIAEHRMAFNQRNNGGRPPVDIGIDDLLTEEPGTI